jgi:hypothetical protein
VTETEFGGSEPASPPQGGGGPQNVTMPLGARDFGDETALDPLAGARNSRKFGGGGLLIFAVVVIAVAGLFCMRTLTKATAWDSFDTDTEKIIEGFLNSVQENGAPPGDATDLAGAMKDERVLAVLSEPYTERQVALEDVHKNPFIIGEVVPTFTPDVEDPDPGASVQEARWRQMCQQRRAQIEQTGAGLQLKSVIDGTVPLAVVEGRIVRVGDTFTTGPMNVTFRVTAISASAVELVGEAPELNLQVPVTLVLD